MFLKIKVKYFTLFSFLNYSLFLLLFSCIFDPYNLFLGLKYVFFYLAFAIFLLRIVVLQIPFKISSQLLLYLILFVFIIPFFSFLIFFIINQDLTNFRGWIYFKPYLFLLLSILLYSEKIDLTKPLIIISTLLSICSLIIVLLIISGNPLGSILMRFGDVNNILTYGMKSYGSFEIYGIDFQSSPILVFPIGYFTWKLINSNSLKKHLFFGGLLSINIDAMFFGATRNNMFVSIILPLTIIIWYSKNRKSIFLLFSILVGFFIMANLETISSMLDLNERSNSVKFDFFKDYLELFSSNLSVLFFGQGLGSDFYTSLRGNVSITELTYFEFIRRFGIPIALLSLTMLFSPIINLFKKSHRDIHYIYLSFFFYLIICATNPFLMSSTGMLILCIVLYNAFLMNPHNKHIN